MRNKIAELEMQLEALKRHATNLHWMARRYADGRMSYVTGLFNDITRYLLVIGCELKPDDGTIWARDGHGRAFDGLTDEETNMGTQPGGPVE